MPATPAQIAANRKNAAQSTGPKTPEGKAASRSNSLQHGLAGLGVVVPPDDQAEVDRLTGVYATRFGATTDDERMIARRAAVMATRLKHCEHADHATRIDRVREALMEFDEAARVAVDPDVAEWFGIADVADPQAPVAAIDRWLATLAGSPVDPDLDLDEDAWELIAVEVDRLATLRTLIVTGRLAAERSHAADRALFDPSAQAERLRRYERAADRALQRALADLRLIELHGPGRAPEATPAPHPGPAPMPAPDPRPTAAPAPTGKPIPAPTSAPIPRLASIGKIPTAATESPRSSSYVPIAVGIAPAPPASAAPTAARRR